MVTLQTNTLQEVKKFPEMFAWNFISVKSKIKFRKFKFYLPRLVKRCSKLADWIIKNLYVSNCGGFTQNIARYSCLRWHIPGQTTFCATKPMLAPFSSFLGARFIQDLITSPLKMLEKFHPGHPQFFPMIS